MPAARNFHRVSFAWQRRASAFRCCARRMCAAARSSSAARAARLSPHDSTKALRAVRTWHRVSAGSFFPPPLAYRAQNRCVRATSRWCRSSPV
jgi:hypothetical protein